MRFRAALSSLLTFVLLGSAGAASACEATCGSAASRGGCHGMRESSGQEKPGGDGAVNAEMQAMHPAGAPHAAGTRQTSHRRTALDAPATRSHPPVVQTGLLPCDRACTLSATSAGENVRDGQDRAPTLTVERLIAQSNPAGTNAGSRRSETPPLRRPSPIRLHTVLRV